MNTNTNFNIREYSPSFLSALIPQLRQPLNQTQSGMAPPTLLGPMPQMQPAFWQPQAVSSFMQQGQPWMATAQYQAVAQPQQQQQLQPEVQRVDATNKQPSAKEFAAAVMVEMREEEKRTITMEFSPEDERMLVEALKEGKEGGLTPRQAIEKLHNVNGHTSLAWKDYLLDHMERLYPKAFPRTTMRLGVSDSSDRKDVRKPTRSKLPPPSFPRRSGFDSNSKGYVICEQQPKNGVCADGPLSAPHGQIGHSTSNGSRRRRGDPADDYHDDTFVPPFTASDMPKPPQREPGVSSSKVTDEDKIFFIHFLRWRLRKGPLPDKQDLYDALAKHTPHHDADAWRKHWNDFPELPDKIYIEARKRADRESYVGSPVLSLSESSDEEDPDDVRGVDRGHATTSHAQARPKSYFYFSVTEEDLRSMALFKVEMGREWVENKSQKACWGEFARLPWNGKRTADGWRNVARHYQEELDLYYVEYLAAALHEEAAAKHTPPQTEPATAFGAAASPEGEGNGISRPQKRKAETNGLKGRERAGGNSESFVEKRTRMEEREVIEIL